MKLLSSSVFILYLVLELWIWLRRVLKAGLAAFVCVQREDVGHPALCGRVEGRLGVNGWQPSHEAVMVPLSRPWLTPCLCSGGHLK